MLQREIGAPFCAHENQNVVTGVCDDQKRGWRSVLFMVLPERSVGGFGCVGEGRLEEVQISRRESSVWMVAWVLMTQSRCGPRPRVRVSCGGAIGCFGCLSLRLETWNHHTETWDSTTNMCCFATAYPFLFLGMKCIGDLCHFH